MQQQDHSNEKHAIYIGSSSIKKRMEHDSDDDFETPMRKVIYIGSASSKRRMEHDSDDDFETPMRKVVADMGRSKQPEGRATKKRKQSEPKEKTASHNNNKGNKRAVKKSHSGKDARNNDSNYTQIYKDITSKRIRTRSNPAELFSLMKGLKESQLLAVEQIGFGSIRYLSVQSIRTCLGFWLITNYDHKNNCLNVGTHKIQITRELVADVLGIPMGDVPVNAVRKPSYKDPVISEWRNQFGPVSKLKTVKKVIEFIKASNDSGRMFKLNFLVVVNTIMCVTTKGGHVNMKFLPSVAPNVDVKKLDWCSYLIDCLQKTKKKWSGLEHYNGPLTFLALLYAHDKGKAILKAVPAIKHYGTASLMELEDDLTAKSDTFLTNLVASIAAKQGNNVDGLTMNHKENGDFGTKNNESNTEDDSCSFIDELNAYVDAIELKCAIEKKACALNTLITDVEGIIKEGTEKYPNDDGIKEAIIEWESMLRRYTYSTMELTRRMGDDKKETGNEDSTSVFDSSPYKISSTFAEHIEREIFSKIEGGEHGKDSNDQKTNRKAQPNSMPSFELISQLTPLDQWTSTDTPAKDSIPYDTNEVENQPTEDAEIQMPILHGKSVSNEEDAPYKTPICVLKKSAPLSVVKHKPQENQNRRRTIKMPDILCSPFAQKKVSLSKRMTRSENKIAYTIFATVNNQWNEVFQTKHGAAVPRVSLESLYPDVDVHISVLKCWACVLNSEERFRNKRDPTRFFCSCNMLADEDFANSVEESSRNTTFYANMESCLREADMDTLIGIELVFIPILHSKHYYIMCFNLKKARVDVIDNLRWDVEFDSKYVFRPQIMQTTLCNYLERASHPVASNLRNCEPKRLEMPWRTVQNSVDCGIFVMRHMETYKCTTIRDWKCGLAGESELQKKQIVELRVKYLAKILLSDINIHKGVVVSEVREHFKRPTEEREALKENMFERITTRVENAL